MTSARKYENENMSAHVYADATLKPCTSAPTCSVHKHRPRPPPCANPDACYRECIRRKEKCPSAMSTVTRRGTPCECARLQSASSRRSNDITHATHRARLQRAYATRSSISRWKPVPDKVCCKKKKKRQRRPDHGPEEKKRCCTIL